MADQSCAMGGIPSDVFGCEATNTAKGTATRTVARVLVTRTHGS